MYESKLDTRTDVLIAQHTMMKKMKMLKQQLAMYMQSGNFLLEEKTRIDISVLEMRSDELLNI